MPGTLYPPHCVRPTESNAEKTVHAALQRQLPDGWIAWHSFRFACRTPDGANLREIDFLIFVPGGGLIAIEVKGGTGWTIEGGRLRRYAGAADSEDPLGQVITAKRVMLEELKWRLGARDTPWVAHLVVFPEVPGYEAPSGYGYEDVTLTSGHLAFLGDALASFAERSFAHARPGNPRTAEVLHAMWCERWVPSLRARDMREVRDRELFELTAAQRGLAQRLDLRGALLVTGGPGSGKTVVAREAAYRWAEEGKRVLYFCYTLGLAHELRAGGFADAHAIREYMKAYVARADPGFDVSDSASWDSAKWRELVRRSLEADASHLDRPDVLIVDEAQDFGADDWRFLDRLRGKDTALLALGDASQRFLADAAIPSDRFDVHIGLEEQLRSPRPIVALAQCIRAGGDAWVETSEHLHVETVGADETRWDALVRAVARQRAEGFEDRDVCILSLAGVTRMTRRPESATDDVSPLAADADGAERALVQDTALRFKGLERPWVIITDLGAELSEAVRLRLYVALTRCTVGASLVVTPAELALITGETAVASEA